MDITFYGKGCFSFKDKKATVVTDPVFDGKEPAKLPNADIMTFSNETLKEAANVPDNALVFDWPGEYESGSIYIEGIQDENTSNPNSIYCYRFPEISICYLGKVSDKLTEETLEKIGNIDVLIVPVGNADALDAKKALEVVEQIDPRAVVPMYYQTEDSEKELTGVEPFLEVMGKKDAETVSNLSVTKSSLSDDKTELFVLSKTG